MPTLLPDTASFNTAIKAPNLSAVHFSADWAEQCAQVDEVLDALAKRVTIKVYKCQAEDLSEISLANKIEAVPTVILFQNGKVVDRVDGADAAKITEKVTQHSIASPRDEEPLEQRLKALINKGPVVLFMKGDRTTPRCGFSRQMIQLLNDTGVKYETFDILTDEEVRQGLKEFSDWPTYPQLYVKGDLIGGLDIVKEMQAAGELEAALKA